MQRVRPRQPAPAFIDPLELANQVLGALAVVQAVLNRYDSTSRMLPHLEEVAEGVRQLAWGPATGEGD